MAARRSPTCPSVHPRASREAPRRIAANPYATARRPWAARIFRASPVILGSEGPNLIRVPLAPGVQGLVHERLPLQRLEVVGLDVAGPLGDGEEPRAQWIGLQLALDVCRMDDPGQPHEGGSPRSPNSSRRTSKVHFSPVRELRAGSIEGPGPLPLGHPENPFRRLVEDLPLRVDEPADEARGRLPGRSSAAPW
jgi:hypothetical protein